MTRNGFLLVSLLLHGAVLLPVTLAPPAHPLPAAAPLTVSLAATASDPRVRSAAQALPETTTTTTAIANVTRAAPTPAVRSTRQRATVADATATEAVRENHLLSLVRDELAHHFVYPLLARRQGWEGEVHVAAMLDANGSLQALRLLRSSGHAILDRDAMDTLSRIGNLPGARNWLNGHDFRFELPVIYRLTRG